ncbi:hypothetical protein H4R19_001319 [Coemansia spiralis]|nr:hypothetical protein H4R19_001319 [Coemansia spiralis]
MKLTAVLLILASVVAAQPIDRRAKRDVVISRQNVDKGQEEKDPHNGHPNNNHHNVHPSNGKNWLADKIHKVPINGKVPIKVPILPAPPAALPAPPAGP